MTHPDAMAAERHPTPRPNLRQILLATCVLFAVIMVVQIGPDWIDDTVALLMLLTAVLANAAALGFWTGLFSALSAFGLYNFFFVEPHFTLLAAKPQDLATLLVFLAAAALAGLLAGRLREQRDAARGRAEALEILSESSGAFVVAQDAGEVVSIVLRQIARLAPAPVVLVDKESPDHPASLPEGVEISAEDLQAAHQALLHGRVEYAAADHSSRFTFHPFPQGEAARFAVGSVLATGFAQDSSYREQAVATILHQASDALERLELARRAEAERIARDRQTHKSALLASLSHDLRTPLATILGSITTLREFEASLSQDARADLLIAVEEEAQRLSGYVEKLLQMTRFTMSVSAHLHHVDPGDCVAAAISRVKRAFPQARIKGDLADLPLVFVEASLLEQAIFNLLENAIRYAPGEVVVFGEADDHHVLLNVEDHGSGLPATVKDWLGGPELTPGTAGVGLGLPICKGIARAVHGELIARQGRRGGACLTLVLPRCAREELAG